MESLIGATALFLGVHWIVSGSPLRGVIVARTGEGPFKAMFALTITASLAWMGIAYARAPYLETWGTAEGFKPLSWVLMALAFAMFGASITARNPTTLGAVPPDRVEARGIVRITRHAGLFALGLWGLAHFPVNGDWASHLLFGSFVIQGLIAPLNLDRKYRKRHGAAWEVFAKQTSHVPFVAIWQGRNRLVLGEINWLAVAAGLALFGLTLAYHQAWFGASPF